MVPHEQNQCFTGRDKFLEELFNKFRQTFSTVRHHGRLALFGMGGIGKTQAALEFVYRYQASYRRIFWISGVNQDALLDGYEKIANRVKILILPDSEPVEIAERVLSWLNQEQDWLLVIDNVDDIDILSTGNLGNWNSMQLLLPQTGPQQHTLITTRNPHADNIPAQGVEVPLFDRKESIELLTTVSNISLFPDSPENDVAEQIVEELGHLPLAIWQAASYVTQVAGSFTKYLRLYKEYRMHVNSWIPQGSLYSHCVATTWAISFDAVRMINPTAAEIFRLLSLLNPDGILIDFLRSGADALPDGLRQLISHEANLLNALLILESFSLLKWNRQNETVVIHRLVQAVVKDEMSDTDLTSFGAITVNIFDQSFPQEVSDKSWAICRLYVDQVMEPLMDPETPETKQSARVMNRVGCFLRYDGKTIDSERLLVRSFEICRRTVGEDHLSTLTVMRNLAITYQMQGRTGEAASLASEVLEKRRRILGEDNSATLASMHNLATMTWDRGLRNDAVAMMEEMLKRNRIVHGEGNPETLVAMSNLAEMYFSQGRWSDAQVLQEEVLEKRKSILWEEHPAVLMSMRDLAVTYQAQGKGVEAATLEEQELEKWMGILGEDHSNTLTTMSSLASTYYAQGRVGDAIVLGEKALAKRHQILGAEHPDTLTSMHNLAMFRSQTEDTVPLHKEVLEKRRRILGEEHPETLATMANLAGAYYTQGRIGDAIVLQEKVFERRRSILGIEHPDTLTSMSSLAVIYRDQGRTDDAVALLEEVLEKRERILGKHHPDTLRCLDNLASMYVAQGRSVEAIMESLQALLNPLVKVTLLEEALDT
jgi:tetratricopeptide (TPR) repeat protein